jgi:predicted nucleic acid-binding protein
LIDEFIWLLQQDAVFTEAGRPPKIKLRDKTDLTILAAAHAGGADVLVTGDKELLELACIGDMDILSPRQFWERLKTRESRRNKRGKPRR